MVNADIVIKSRIDPTFNPGKTTWANIYKRDKFFFASLKAHTRKLRYHLDMFKCGKESCKIYKLVRIPRYIWDEITKRPRFIPLSI